MEKRAFVKKHMEDIVRNRKLVCLTAYTASIAKRIDPYCDLLLVGDSVAMTVYGHKSTQYADMDMMVRHTQAVLRGADTALVVVDIPAGHYEESPQQALESAQYLIEQTDAHAVKLEGGSEIAPTIAHLTQNGIAVIGHIGLLPQSLSDIDNFTTAGRTESERQKLHSDAHALKEAGAFALVLEAMIESVARDIALHSGNICIGIGASAACQGQILVTDDLVGLFDSFSPKFSTRYADIGTSITEAARQWHDNVVNGHFPTSDHIYLK